MKKITLLFSFYMLFIISTNSVVALGTSGHYIDNSLGYVPTGYSSSNILMRQGNSITDAGNSFISDMDATDLFVDFIFDTTRKNVYLVYTNDGTVPTKSNGIVVTCSFSAFVNSIDRIFVGQVPMTGNNAGSEVRYVFYISDGSLADSWGRVAGVDQYKTSWTEGDFYFSYNVWYSSNLSSGNWSSTSTWKANSVPNSNTALVIIKALNEITLDQDCSVYSLLIRGTFTASDATPRTLTISKSASGSSTTLSNNGTWANGSGGSTVVFTGAPESGDAVHTVTGNISFQNITVNKTGGASNVGAGFGTGCSVSGTLQIGAGGYISTDPPASFYGNNAILAFNQGSGAEYVVNSTDKTWSTSQIPNSITVTSGTVTLNDNRSATGDLIISSGATLNINAAKQLTIGNSFTQAGSLNLKSTSDGTATIITPTTVNITGNTRVQQYLAANRNYYLAAPVSGAVIPAGNTYYKFVEALNNGSTWTDVTANESLTFEVGNGYVVKPSTTGTTIEFSGALNQGDKTIIGLTSTGTTPAKARFNLVGNPYPSYLNWNSITKTNVGNTMWYRTHNGSNYAFYTYNTVDGRGGVGVPETVTNWIPPMQAFWVRVNAGQTGSLGMTNAMRNHQDVVGNVLKAPAQKQSDLPLIRLVVSNSVNSDETVLYFNENAVDTYDSYDSEKFFLSAASIPEIYTTAGNEQLVINGMNNYYPGLELPLGFNAGQINNYSIRASQLLNLADVKVVLKDKLTSAEFDLTSGDSYEFTSHETSGVDRFSVLFKSASGTTGECCDIINAGMFAYTNNGRIFVNCNNSISENTTVSVYNGLGQLVHIQHVNSLSTTLNKNFDNGVYLLKVENESGSVILRTLVQ